MEWLSKMNDALEYIESNLDDDTSYDRAAQIARCSVYHFQRMFSYITNVPLSEYIRRRRLTMAALELQTSDVKVKVKVIDLAMKFGYESSEAFSRAFKNLHGITPASARASGVSLKLFPRISFSITIKGDTEMNYRIESKEAFTLFGVELKTTVVDGQCFKDIPKFIGDCVDDGRVADLVADAGKPPNGIFDAGVTYDHNPSGSMSYAMACYMPDKPIPSKYKIFDVPATTWAVFETGWATEHDDEKIHSTWERIYSEWFPSASYEHADVDFDLEMYFGDRDGDCRCEIWIPVIKK